MAARKIFKAKEVRGGGRKSQTGNHKIRYWPIHQKLLGCKNMSQLCGWTMREGGMRALINAWKFGGTSEGRRSFSNKKEWF